MRKRQPVKEQEETKKEDTIKEERTAESEIKQEVKKEQEEDEEMEVDESSSKDVKQVWLQVLKLQLFCLSQSIPIPSYDIVRKPFQFHCIF